jgi:hypothetical protein
MSKSTTLSLDPAVRTSRMQKLVSFLTTGQPWPLYTEEFESSMAFAATRAAWDAADAAVDINDPVTRLEANYTGALYRDAVYAHAGRNYLLKLGHHNAFRELYEGGKASIDNEREWEQEA